MKKQLALATAALMALSLAACGSTATASSAAESTSTAASSEAASTVKYIPTGFLSAFSPPTAPQLTMVTFCSRLQPLLSPTTLP